MTGSQLEAACHAFGEEDRLIFFQHLQKLGARFYMKADNERWSECIQVNNGQRAYWVVASYAQKAYKRTIEGDGTKVCKTGLMRMGGTIRPPSSTK